MLMFPKFIQVRLYSGRGSVNMEWGHIFGMFIGFYIWVGGVYFLLVGDLYIWGGRAHVRGVYLRDFTVFE